MGRRRQARGWALGLAVLPVIFLGSLLGNPLVAALVDTTAEAGPLPVGVVKVKGTRWVDGVKGKVRCKTGHTLTLEDGRRTLTLDGADPKCAITVDAPSLVFEGTEDVVIKRGKPRRQRVLVGSETQTAEIDGGLRSLLSLGRDGAPKKDKGTIAYLIDSGGPVVVFLGSYTAGKF